MRIFLNNNNYIISFVFLLCLLLSNKIVIADSEAESLYQSGLHWFDLANFENSIEKLEDAVAKEFKYGNIEETVEVEDEDV